VYADTNFAIGRRLGIKGYVKATEAKGISVDKLKFSWRETGQAMLHVKVHGTGGTPIAIAWDKRAKVHLGSHSGVDIHSCI
jgi:DNA helicase TIP49 (TBP-interacting protein)